MKETKTFRPSIKKAMKTTNYKSLATDLACKLNLRYGEEIFFVTDANEDYALIQNLYHNFEGNNVGIMIYDGGIEGSITGLTVKFDNIEDMIDGIDELFVVKY